MQSRAVFPLDHVPLAADHLDRVEAAVPDTDTRKRKGADQSSFHTVEEPVPDHKSHQARDQRCHGQHDPVLLIDKHAQHLYQEYSCLPQMAAVAHVDPSGCFLSILIRHAAPPTL